MNIYKKAETDDATIIGLIQEIKQKKIRKYSEKEIEDYKKQYELNKLKNKKTKDFIRRVKKNIENGKYSLSQEMIMLDSLDELKRGKNVTFKNKGKQTEYKALIDIDYMRNTLNKMQGKDFHYRVNDGFSTYKVKRSKILKMQDNSFFIEKFKNGIEKAIEKTKKNTLLSENQRKKKIEILQNVLLPVINYNKLIDSKGKEDFKTLNPDFVKEIDVFFDSKIPKEDKSGKYPILVHIFDNESIIM